MQSQVNLPVGVAVVVSIGLSEEEVVEGEQNWQVCPHTDFIVSFLLLHQPNWLSVSQSCRLSLHITGEGMKKKQEERLNNDYIINSIQVTDLAMIATSTSSYLDL